MDLEDAVEKYVTDKELPHISIPLPKILNCDLRSSSKIATLESSMVPVPPESNQLYFTTFVPFCIELETFRVTKPLESYMEVLL